MNFETDQKGAQKNASDFNALCDSKDEKFLEAP